MASSYVDKVAIVTGASSGIGLGITRHLIEQGAKVVLADINVEAGKAAAKELGENAHFCYTDVTSWESICNLFREAASRFGGRIDIVIANAGITQMRNFRTSEPTHFTTAATSVQDLAATPPDLTVIEVNTKGSLYTIHAALAYFRAQTPDQDGWRGKIVCTGSSASLYSFPNDALYATSKYGVLGMIRAIGPKVFREKITINGFGPSCVRTAIGPQDFFDKLEQQGRLTPMTTIASCMDMFLAPSSRLTGQFAECNRDRHALRSLPQFMDEVAKENMDEFHPYEEIEEALNNRGYDVI